MSTPSPFDDHHPQPELLMPQAVLQMAAALLTQLTSVAAPSVST
jgi:hypothetical protein